MGDLNKNEQLFAQKSTYSKEILIFWTQKKWRAGKNWSFQLSESIFEATNQLNRPEKNFHIQISNNIFNLDYPAWANKGNHAKNIFYVFLYANLKAKK